MSTPLGHTSALVCAFLLSTACAMSQMVEGFVIDSATGAGIPSVEVEIFEAAGSTIEAIGNKTAAYSATTDSQGRFHIEAVKDGAYTARYRAAGLFTGEPPRPFQVIAGTPVKLEARMTQAGRIAGRVVDGGGNAVPNARMELARSGRIILRMPTDRDGKFELPALPGAYTLAVDPPFDLKPPVPEPDSNQKLTWVRVYYPGVATLEAAGNIAISPGLDFSGVEMRLIARPLHSVRGAVLNPDGTPAPAVSISLENPTTPSAVESASDGTFELMGVLDGEWRLSAAAQSDGVTLRGAEWIAIAGRDIENVKLRLKAPFTVRGRVVLDAPQGAAPPQPPSVRLSPVSRSRRSDPPFFAASETDGNFSLDGVYPGAYLVGGLESPTGYYLDGVRMGEGELTGPEVELWSGTIPITVVYKTNGGTVRGTVEKCASGSVVLVPQDPAMRRAEFVRSARCDSLGRYEITALRPGEYYAQAFVGDSTGLWGSAFDDSLINLASRITVRAGEISAADLRAINQAPY